MTQQKPTPGRMVHFYLNDDLVMSPALVVNTHESTDVEVLSEQEPWTPEGSYVFDEDTGEMVKTTVKIVQPEPGRADLEVHGLVKTYRVYNAPMSDEPTPGHWMWPPREG